MVVLKNVFRVFLLTFLLLGVACGIKAPPKPVTTAPYGGNGVGLPR